MTHFNNIHFEYSNPSSNAQGNFLESVASCELVLEGLAITQTEIPSFLK
jgi:hypothetical protein